MHGLYASVLAPVDLLRPRQLENQYTILKLIIGILRINRHKQFYNPFLTFLVPFLVGCDQRVDVSNIWSRLIERCNATEYDQ
ncbi:hypothetical protein M514_28179 [Trichuris suis]|uniref:Uncharacterized protein n=1 Tax=Trichuris suis TaxID=68888 RepID=A0A085MQZ8_9BILA|nr:hypothetical protein M514_28179 [Trichuris suis]